jgi:hypothetical protein
MPRGDGTGPGGMGPMTGRAAGFCAGYSMPGYANPVGGRGMGMGWGRGRGFGWGRTGYGFPAYGAAAGPYAYGSAPFIPTVAPQQELDSLKGQAEYFEDALDGIKKRIEELESRKSSKD